MENGNLRSNSLKLKLAIEKEVQSALKTSIGNNTSNLKAVNCLQSYRVTDILLATSSFLKLHKHFLPIFICNNFNQFE